jgi:hypothetical protein
MAISWDGEKIVQWGKDLGLLERFIDPAAILTKDSCQVGP